MYHYVFMLICILSSWSVLRFLKWKKTVFNPIEKLKGPKFNPFVGTLYVFNGASRHGISEVLRESCRRYGPFFRAWKINIPEIQIMTPEHFELIMNNSVHITKASGYNYLSPWLGDGLLTSNGSKWHQRRKMLTPTFHFRILDNFMPIFEEKSKILVKCLEERCDGKPFDIYPYFNHCALDIICDYPLLPDGRLFKRNLKVMHDFTNKVISDRRKLLLNNPNRKQNLCDILISQKKRLSFLDLLIDASDKLSDADIREEVDTFMFAGHDTTNVASSWCLLLLAHHQDIQEKVYEEVKDVLQDKKAPESLSELTELKYLERCIKEALRLYPSLPLIARTVTEDITIDGYKVPKGTDCNLHIFELHRNPNVFPDPDKFDPDRFLPENCAKRHPFAYVPFSAGPRNCIGQRFAILEEKTVLSTVLRSYKVLPVENLESSKYVFEIMLRPLNGINVILEKRSD